MLRKGFYVGGATVHPRHAESSPLMNSVCSATWISSDWRSVVFSSSLSPKMEDSSSVVVRQPTPFMLPLSLSPSSFRFPAVAFIHHDQNSAICFSSPSPGIIPDYPSSGLEMIAVGGYFYVTVHSVQKCHNQLQNFGAALVVQQITSDSACTESNTAGVQRW